jgi:hypothetical protein
MALSVSGAWAIFDSNFDQTIFIAINPSYVNVYAVKTGIRATCSSCGNIDKKQQ